MGNISSNGITPLAMMAVARQLRLQRFQILEMWESLRTFSDKDGFVNRKSFDLSLTRAKIIQPVALQIFDLLFTMWDHHAIGEIPAKKFAVGIAPLACAVDDIPSVLRFALHVNDETGRGEVSPRALHDVLISIDNTASYFGDVHLKPADIDNVVESVFEVRNGRRLTSMPSDLVVRRLQNNAYIRRFVSGKPRRRVHFEEDMVLGTENAVSRVTVDRAAQGSAPTTPVPPTIQLPENLVEDKENKPTPVHHPTKDLNNYDLQTPVAATRSNSGFDESWASFFSEDTRKSRDPPSTIIINPYHHPVSSPLSFVRGVDPPSFQA